MLERHRNAWLERTVTALLGSIPAAQFVFCFAPTCSATQELELEWLHGGHRMGISSLAFSPDGLEFATTSADSTVKRWNVGDGVLLETFDLPYQRGREIASVLAWSPTGAQVAFCGLHGKLTIVDLVERSQTVLQLESTCRSLAWGQNGELLLVGRDEPGILLVVGGSVIGSLGGHSGSIVDLAVSVDGNLAAGGSFGSHAYVWNLSTRQLVLALGGHERGTRVAISPDGQLLATADASNVRVWRISDGELLESFSESLSDPKHVRFVDDLTLVYSTWAQVLCRSLETGELLFELDRFREGTSALDVSREMELLVLGSTRGHVELRSSRTGELVRPVVSNPMPVYGLALSPDRTRVVTSGHYEWFEVLDALTGRLRASIRLPQVRILDPWTALSLMEFPDPELVYDAVFSADSAYVYGGRTGARVGKWDASTGAELTSFHLGGESDVRCLALLPAGQRVITGLADGTVKLAQLSDGAVIQTFEGHAYGIRSVAVSHSGTLIATGDEAGYVKLWNPDSGALVSEFYQPWAITQLDFSPDDSSLAASSLREHVTIRGVGDGALIHELFHPSTDGTRYGEIWSVRFSPDGSELMTSSHAGVLFFDAQEGTPLERTVSETMYIRDAIWLDDDRIALGRLDGTVVSLRLPLEEER